MQLTPGLFGSWLLYFKEEILSYILINYYKYKSQLPNKPDWCSRGGGDRELNNLDILNNINNINNLNIREGVRGGREGRELNNVNTLNPEPQPNI